MNLPARVRNVFGSGISRPIGLPALILPLVFWAASASLLPSGASPALAGDDERGAREGERREGDESPEARYRREGDREGRDSPEARYRREGDRDRGDSPEARSRRDGDHHAASGFRPQTDREAALYRMIMKLHDEVAQLRRELDQMRGGREGDQAYRRDSDRPVLRDAPRDGDRPRTDAPRDGDRRYVGGPRDPEPARSGRDVQTMQAKIFERYDRNGDKKIALEEFLAMREGTRNPEVRARWQGVFAQGDRNRDGSWSFEEFLAAVQAQRREGDARRTDAPREGDRPVRRDGDRPRTDTPRDGDQPIRRDAPRDGDAPARDRPRDGDKPDRDAPRDG